MDTVTQWLASVESLILKHAQDVSQKHKLPLLHPKDLVFYRDNHVVVSSPTAEEKTKTKTNTRWPEGILCKFTDFEGRSLIDSEVHYGKQDSPLVTSVLEQKEQFGQGLHSTCVSCALTCALHYFVLPQHQTDLSLVFLTLPRSTLHGNSPRPISFVKTTINRSFMQLRSSCVLRLELVHLQLPSIKPT